MKLSKYIPEAHNAIKQNWDMSQKLQQFDYLSKAVGSGVTGQTASSPSFGMDYVVNSWVRQQSAYRKRMILDLIQLASNVAELAGPINVLVNEVFRKGFEILPAFAQKCNQCGQELERKSDKCPECDSEDLKEPDESQLKQIKTFQNDANAFDQSLEEVLRQIFVDINMVDDGFLYVIKRYKNNEDAIVSKPLEIRRIHPASIEWDLNGEGIPKANHWFCYIHRMSDSGQQLVLSSPGKCTVDVEGQPCGLELEPAMFKFDNRGSILYLSGAEVCKVSKFYPGELYGFSPILTVFEKTLALTGMDKCYDGQTEVLTKNGWKFFKDTNSDDEYATLNKQHIVEYQKPTNVQKFFHIGKMYHIETKNVDLLVTPHHRMYISDDGGKTFHIEEAQNIIGKPVKYLRASSKGRPLKRLSNANKEYPEDRWENYNGIVYCVEVPNTLLCVRRNGKTVWSGNTLFRHFFERKTPPAILMVHTDDVEGLRREKLNAQRMAKENPDDIPWVGVSARQGTRGRTEFVKLFPTLAEYEFTQQKTDIRERIAAMWGVSPLWQGSLESSGGLSTQTQQLVVTSRVVEKDQRILNEKLFPFICKAFGITDWKLVMKQPEEKAEQTRLTFMQQRISAANMLNQMGFDVVLMSDSDVIDDVQFKVSGKPNKPQAFGGMGGFPPSGGLGGGIPGQEPGGDEGGASEEGDGGIPNQGEPPSEAGNEAFGGTQEENPFAAAQDKMWIGQLHKAGYCVEQMGRFEITERGMVNFEFMSNGERYLAKFTPPDGKLLRVDQKPLKNPDKKGHVAQKIAQDSDTFVSAPIGEDDEDEA